MYKSKIKAPIDILDEQAYNLCDFVEEFSEFNSEERNSLFGCKNISENLIKTIKSDRLYFQNRISVCPYCGSKSYNKDGYRNRKLVFLHKGVQKCNVQKYRCKKMW